MAWYFRAIQHPDGRWRCVHGSRTYDYHEQLTDALDHLRQLALELGDAAEFFIHLSDGSVERA